MNHSESKRQGKLKGKHLRLALNWANAMQARSNREPADWVFAIDKNALQAAYLIGSYTENIQEFFTKFVGASQSSTDLQPDRPGVEAEPAEANAGRTHSAKIDHLLTRDIGQLLSEVDADHRAFIKSFIKSIMTMRTVWIDSTSLRQHSTIRDNMNGKSTDEQLMICWRCMSLIAAIGFGHASRSSNTSGAKKDVFGEAPLRA